jgi:DNA polymerase-3 subunit delta
MPRGKLARVYLLLGEEEFTRELWIQSLIERVLEPGSRDFNLEVRHAGQLNAEELDSALNTPPLLADRRVVVLRDVTSLKKGPRHVLDRYLEAPADNTVLLLVEPGLLPRTEKTLPERCEVVEFGRLDERALQKWVEQYVEKTLEARIDPAAAKLLVSVVGNEMSDLASELDKLTSYSGAGTIDVEAVEDLVGVRHGETLAELIDAIAARDASRSLTLLGPVLSQPKTTGVSILLALTTQILAMAHVRALMDEGVPAGRLQSLMWEFLPAGRGMMVRPWKEAVPAFVRAAAPWTSAELAAACETLLRTDMSLKDTKSSSDEQILSTAILELCARRKAAPSKR